MSLIDDALKRAQEEAARQEEAHRLARRPWIAPQPPRPRVRAGGIAAIAAAAALAAAGSAWLLVRRHGPAAPPSSSPAPRPAPATTRASAVPGASLAPPLESVEVPPPPGPPFVEKGKEKTKRPAPPGSAIAPDSPPAETAPAPPPPRLPRASPPIPDGKTFVGTVSPAGQDPIELDGIVFSESNPVAVIGGRFLGPGASIGDFEIVKIEQNRVTLRGRGVTIFLTPS